ncbi:MULTISPECIES: alanine racemase [unclassified Francisella]|uniref:alanine racemase n=1 Tax=unclassified Francisella TaxID=2610885 RepID=UPI002E363BDD|nr:MULTISPECIES: alanine racemase [unclassified Francisella]MED7819937.1 alanine racemase [Francisella sp. 19S2-4]MED7830757.1 alanine racemase [Francisella sp. 19S2-10]
MNSMNALQQDWAINIQQNTKLLNNIAYAIDGPFHIINPESFANNLSDFQKILQSHNIAGQVYFGKKANKAGAWLTEVAKLNGAVDVASIPEFVHALSKGIRGENIGVTGAAKSDELLWLSARHGALVAIDALDELERAISIVANINNKLRILLRVLPPNSPNSRFGFNSKDIITALERCKDVKNHINMEGFSFHLDGYLVEPRVEMAFMLIDWCIKAREYGFPSSSISIGGGFACSYVEKEDWNSFKDALNSNDFHANKTFSHFYPYYQSPTGANMLDAILKSSIGNISLTNKLIDTQIKLYLEPGRALLDGAGMTVFPVQGFKKNDEHGIVTVAGLSMSLSEQWKNSEFLPSPILIQRGQPRPQNPISGTIGGSSCMEYDVLTWRKIKFPAEPRYGDLLIYPNTAGYQMDKNESEFHQLPLPPKVVVTQQDEEYFWRIDQ